MQTQVPMLFVPNLSARPSLADTLSVPSLRRRFFLLVVIWHSSSSAQSAFETQAMREETQVDAKSYEYCRRLTS